MMADRKKAVRKTVVREEAHPAKAVRKTVVREEAHPAKAVRKTVVREEAHPAKAVRKTVVREEAHPAKAVRKTVVREEAHPAKAVQTPHKKLTETAVLPETATKAKRVKPPEKSPVTPVVEKTSQATPRVRRIPKTKVPKKEKNPIDEQGHEANLDLEEEQEGSHEEGPAAEPSLPKKRELLKLLDSARREGVL